MVYLPTLGLDLIYGKYGFYGYGLWMSMVYIFYSKNPDPFSKIRRIHGRKSHPQNRIVREIPDS